MLISNIEMQQAMSNGEMYVTEDGFDGWVDVGLTSHGHGRGHQGNIHSCSMKRKVGTGESTVVLHNQKTNVFDSMTKTVTNYIIYWASPLNGMP